MNATAVFRIVREEFPFLLLSAAGGLVAGVVLKEFLVFALALPGVLVMLPALMNIRGAVESALAARLGTAYHLGLVRPRWGFNSEVRENYIGSLILALIVAIASACFAYYVSFAFGLSTLSLPALLGIALLTSVVGALVNSTLTVLFLFWAIRQKMDPDNVVIPVITLLGDFVIIVLAYLSALIFVNLGIR